MEQGEEESSGTKGRIEIDEVVCTLLRTYPQLTLSSFEKSFKEGGITEEQAEIMYSEAAKYRYEDYRILASFQGIKLPEDPNDSSGQRAVRASEVPPGVTDIKTFVFGDPKDYEKLTDEQKTQLTEKMLSNHKDWVKSGQKHLRE